MMKLVSGASALFLTLCIALGLPTEACLAQVKPMYVGGGLALGYNLHSLDLPLFRGDTLCGSFTSGRSFEPSGFLMFEMPLGDPSHSLWISPRLYLSSTGATITTPGSDQAQARSPVDSSLISVSDEYQMKTTLVSLGADFFVKYPIASQFFILGGPSIGYLLQRNATLTQAITSPPNAVFSNGQQTQSVPNSDVVNSSGQIENSMSIMAAFTLGASLDVPLSPKVLLAPELDVSIPLTSIRTDYSWHITTISLGVALKFNVAPEPKLEVVQTPPVPPPPPPKSELSATVSISGVMKDSTGQDVETPEPEIRIEEFERREAYPALNYIFFDEDNASIPSRYRLYSTPMEASAFRVDSLQGSTTEEVYHDELNVLGKRMVDSPSVQITLTGTNSETGSEAKDSTLSLRRAQSIRSYLVNVWQIAASRIHVSSEGLPSSPSSTTTPDGAQENRRVEITSSNPSVLDPLAVETIDRTMNPPIIRLRTIEYSNLSLAENTLYLKQGDRMLASYRGPGPMEQWHPMTGELPRTDSPLVATLHMTDSMGTQFQTADSVNVHLLTIRKKREERVQDKIIEHYNLITFSFDKSDLNERSMRVISEIARSITPATKVIIQGYTDITGESAHNLELSESRAKAVESALKQQLGDRAESVAFQTEGEGQNNLVDNRLPEGRFLSRTVFVELQKPVQ